MTPDAESNLLKAKHFLKVNKIEYHELHPNVHFRVFIPQSDNRRFLDLWPTTLKWQDMQTKKNFYGIESFINHFEKVRAEHFSKKEINKNILYSRQPELIRDANTYIERYKTPGGWLVQSMHLSHGVLAMAFVPDPNYEWILEPIKPKVAEGE